MMNKKQLLKYIQRGEGAELECKLGLGGLPKDIWPTYSAFANSNGGIIIIGLKEVNQSYENVDGIDVVKLQKQFWDHINSSHVSLNILQSDDVYPLRINGKSLLIIHVPRALRQQKPVSINPNPYIGTYRRNFEGDYRCTKQEIDTMIAESTNLVRDHQIIHGFNLTHVHDESLKRYRQRFTNLNPTHIWNDLTDLEFLKRIGGYRENQETHEAGLTAAGLLMFGEEYHIVTQFSHYFMDYREHVRIGTNQRWDNRITSQTGDWSGNLFDYFHKVAPKLLDNLPVPFQLNDDCLSRKLETDVHIAIREALLNTIIHADFNQNGNIIIEKNDTSFTFINHGVFRIPLEKAIRGGTSDIRNQTLARMFGLIGYGERAGYGLEFIHQVWHKHQWLDPVIEESFTPDRVKLTLTTKSDLKSSLLKNDGYVRFGAINKIVNKLKMHLSKF